MLKMGVVGYGYWGPNLARNFHALRESTVVAICDENPDRLRAASEQYPQALLTQDFGEVLRSSQVEAVALATPVFTHFDLARQALLNGKHVFVEKPFTSTSEQAQTLIDLALGRGLKIMVDHTYLFTPAVRRIKRMVDAGELGRLYYYDSTRINLGLFQPDVNVIWDLAPHDFSIMDHVLKERPEAIVAHGKDFVGNRREGLAYVTVYCADNLMAHFSFNWLSPVKVRTTVIGGDQRMLVWNDLEADEKLKIYDRGVRVNGGKEGEYKILVEYRMGDMYSPQLEHVEALRLEAQSFVDAVTRDEAMINDGEAGLRVVRMLEAADRSLKAQGEAVRL